ncbi:aconitate hydratase AcnA [Rhizobium sp. CNPSo 4039]|uniref:aconitate hydratase AcnA n=1 Tax=Rhizobium sp. CNPSo 4039 TaxID=3021409 RepID=UPI00254D22E9|nr:aconitate hydratase AcnA [Rhizobium sp. CNPSo 4039]MDK4717563.1 aconitate hydratase AcnA [Rhizobium sp. CNPSo 4039]
MSLSSKQFAVSLADGGPSFVSLSKAEQDGIGCFHDLPVSLMILAEDALRHGELDLAAAISKKDRSRTIHFRPSRILMQDSSGIPVLADLAALRDAAPDPRSVEPLIPVDLVVDHSVEVDHFGTSNALAENLAIEFKRNRERYRFLRWAQQAFHALRVVPPGRGICHQINLEVLANVVSVINGIARPDTMLGTDSHSTMVNALGVLGWGVGGIEALSAMLGRSVALRIPKVVGVRLLNRLPPGSTATDLALALTAFLRKLGVVEKIVEFHGPGLRSLRLSDRATIANMAPEYGATMGFFPIDDEVLAYLRLTARSAEHIQLVDAYSRAQGLRQSETRRRFDQTVDFDLATVEPSVAGPSRPNQTMGLSAVPSSLPQGSGDYDPDGFIRNGDIAIAAITSCTNTANTDAMLRAGLLARAARQRGLKPPAWVKTSLSPGSQATSEYLRELGLLDDLAAVGFDLVGYGCMTCMGNSGPLSPDIEATIRRKGLSVAAILSGNRNFEGRVHPLCQSSYLASPPLVVAYAIAGNMRQDLSSEPLGTDREGRRVMLADIWPSDEAVAAAAACLSPDVYTASAKDVFDGEKAWTSVEAPTAPIYHWEPESQFIRRPPFANGPVAAPLIKQDILGARILALLGDNVTTDHISPVSRILPQYEAGKWLVAQGVSADDLQSYSARRVNHDVMARGTFANPRLRNRLAGGEEGGFTRLSPDGKLVTIHDAADTLRACGTPMVIIAGRDYGAGSARDWAAKGTRILGISAVIAEGFERIHRSNLVALGVLPLQFPEGAGAASLGLDGFETIDFKGLKDLRPGGQVSALFYRNGELLVELDLLCRIETEEEAADLRGGGVLPSVLQSFVETG